MLRSVGGVPVSAVAVWRAYLRVRIRLRPSQRQLAVETKEFGESGKGGWAVADPIERCVEVALQLPPTHRDDAGAGGILEQGQRLRRQGGQTAQCQTRQVAQSQQRWRSAAPLLLSQRAAKGDIEGDEIGVAAWQSTDSKGTR